jgi:exodeoxyribonuclease VII small subunit
MDAPSPATDLAALSFEDALKRLETIVQRLESGEASLEDSITLYTEGQGLKAHCEAKLQSATMRIEAIQQNDVGEAIGTKPFDAANGTPSKQ